MRIHCIVLGSLLSFFAVAAGQEPLAQYKFNSSTSPDARDSAGRQLNPGRLGPEARRNADSPGMASPFSLDLSAAGTDSWVEIGQLEGGEVWPSMTIASWIKLLGNNDSQTGQPRPRLLSNVAPQSPLGFSWEIDNGTSPSVDSESQNSLPFAMSLDVAGQLGTGRATTLTQLPAADWAFVAVTYDGTQVNDNTTFYYGTEGSSVFQWGEKQSLAGGPIPNPAHAGIGYGVDADGLRLDFSINGLQDDVRIYDSVLSLEQLEAIRLENLIQVGEPFCDPSTFGDFDGDGEVGFSDFLIISANFGLAADSHKQGDANCDGFVGFSDFLHHSSWFGVSLSNSMDIVSVPEPSTYRCSLLLLLTLVRRRRKLPDSTC